jgi:hypothetical protein
MLTTRYPLSTLSTTTSGGRSVGTLGSRTKDTELLITWNFNHSDEIFLLLNCVSIQCDPLEAIPWSWVLEMPKAVLPLNKCSTFYGTRSIITAFTRALYQFLTRARRIQSTPSHFYNIRFLITRIPHLHLDLPSGLFPCGFPTKILLQSPSLPRVLHALHLASPWPVHSNYTVCLKNIFTMVFQMLLCGECCVVLIVQHLERWSLYTFKCKRFRNTRHAVILGIPL